MPWYATKPARAAWSLPSLVLVEVATASLAAGVIHFAAVPEHLATYRLAGVFFIALGTFEVGWAALIAVRPSRGLYLAGAAAAVGTIAVWALSRISGLPFGPSAGIPEPVGRPDVVATIFEELLVLGTLLLVAEDGKPGPLGRRAYRGGLALTAAVAVPATIWAVAAIHGGASAMVPIVVPARGSMAAGLPGPRSVAQLLVPAALAAIYLLYLAGYPARMGRPSPWWNPDPAEAPGPVPVYQRDRPADRPSPPPRPGSPSWPGSSERDSNRDGSGPPSSRAPPRPR